VLNRYVGAGRNSRGENVEMIAEAWAVVYRDWGYHMLHSHHDSAWSGVYYVHTGQMAPDAGLIEFLDPRPAGKRTANESKAASPTRSRARHADRVPELVAAPGDAVRR